MLTLNRKSTHILHLLLLYSATLTCSSPLSKKPACERLTLHELINKDLRRAVEKGDSKRVRNLLATKANPNQYLQGPLLDAAGQAIPEEDQTPNEEALFSLISWAAQVGNTDIVTALARKGAYLDANKNGIGQRTPLHDAICAQHPDTAKALIALGAPKDTLDIDGKSALFYAAENNQIAVMQALIGARAAVDATNPKIAGTPLDIACYKGHKQAVMILLLAGANPNARNHSAMTPLMSAAMEGHLEIIKLLLKHDADPHLYDQYGCTADGWASSLGHNVTAMFLLDRCVMTLPLPPGFCDNCNQ